MGFQSKTGRKAVLSKARISFKHTDGLNSEASQATGRKPSEAIAAERPLLRMPDADAVRRQHLDRPATRKVSRESLVTFEGCRYSVRPKFVGKTVELVAKDGTLTILLGKEIVSPPPSPPPGRAS